MVSHSSMHRLLQPSTLHVCFLQRFFSVDVLQYEPSLQRMPHRMGSCFFSSAPASGSCGSFPRRQKRFAGHVVHASISHTSTATITSVLVLSFSFSLFFVHHTAGCPSAHVTCAHRHRLRTQTAELIPQRRSRLTRTSTGAGSFSTASTPNFVYK